MRSSVQKVRIKGSGKSHKEFVKTRFGAPIARASMGPMPEQSRPTGEQMLAKLQHEQRARLRIYIGAAPGVGKTYSMIEDAHTFRREGVDVVIGFVETHGRADTEARIGDLEVVPRRTDRLPRRGAGGDGPRRHPRAKAGAVRRR